MPRVLNPIHSFHLNSLLFIPGGAKAGSDGFNVVTASASSRKTFLENVIKFLRKWDFDGVDIDWEFPEDTHSLAQLCKVRRGEHRDGRRGGERDE